MCIDTQLYVQHAEGFHDNKQMHVHIPTTIRFRSYSIHRDTHTDVLLALSPHDVYPSFCKVSSTSDDKHTLSACVSANMWYVCIRYHCAAVVTK